jgi:hypothetical protein
MSVSTPKSFAFACGSRPNNRVLYRQQFEPALGLTLKRTRYKAVPDANSGAAIEIGSDFQNVTIQRSLDDPINSRIQDRNLSATEKHNVRIPADDRNFDNHWRIEPRWDVFE